MMNLSTLLWINDSFTCRSGLPEAFGDFYLCSVNHLYRKIRFVAISLGASFDHSPSGLTRDYRAASLLMLPSILDAGVIPYHDNLSVLRQLAGMRPNLMLSGSSLISELASNHVLHESLHYIADRLLPRSVAVSPHTSGTVLRLLAGEAFAIGTERVVGAVADSRVHQLFYYCNAYPRFTDDQHRLLSSAIAIFGYGPILRFSVAVFFMLMLRRGQPTVECVEETSRYIFGEALSRADSEILRILAVSVFTLNPGFRTETTPLFFRSQGYEREYQQLLDTNMTFGKIRNTEILSELQTIVGTIVDVVDLEKASDQGHQEALIATISSGRPADVQCNGR